jgi:hypothetical protein
MTYQIPDDQVTATQAVWICVSATAAWRMEDAMQFRIPLGILWAPAGLTARHVADVAHRHAHDAIVTIRDTE